MIIRQGDAYSVPLLLERDGQSLGPETLKRVTVCFGGLKKEYPGALYFQDGLLLFPLTEEETRALPAGRTVYVDVFLTLKGDSRMGLPEPMPVLVLGTDCGEEETT